MEYLLDTSSQAMDKEQPDSKNTLFNPCIFETEEYIYYHGYDFENPNVVYELVACEGNHPTILLANVYTPNYY